MKPIAKLNHTTRLSEWVRKQWVVIGLVATVAVLIYGNGRMVYLAHTSQPECVPHHKQATSGAAPIAAKSSC